MDAVTTEQLLREIASISADSRMVLRIEQRFVDVDILELRVHLQSEMFINVFYNLESNKTAFALIQNNTRIFGIDNAKTGWHIHPFHDPTQHIACESVTFAVFLAQVEAHMK